MIAIGTKVYDFDGCEAREFIYSLDGARYTLCINIPGHPSEPEEQQEDLTYEQAAEWLSENTLLLVPELPTDSKV